jgi:hypothetical protein
MHEGQQACISSNAVRNLYFIRSGGEILSKNQIATIMIGRFLVDAGDESSSQKNVKDALQDFFQSEKAEVCFLYHQKPAVTHVSNMDDDSKSITGGLNEFHSLGIPQPLTEPALPHDTMEAKAMHQYANMNRCAQGINDAQEVFLGVAWVLPAEKLFSNSFPT